jgi:hypothetical protein
LASISDGLAAASLAVAVVALSVAWYAIVRANKTTSASTLVTLNEGFRQAWGRFLTAYPDTRNYELAELLNLCEIACAVYLEKSLSGNSRKLMFEYLDGIFQILVKNEYSNEHVPPLLQSKTTFVFIKQFLRTKPRPLSVTIPPRWYES